MAMRLEVGNVVITNYDTEPCLVVSISRGCTCPEYGASCDFGDNAPPSQPHMHLTCEYLDGPSKGRKAYLNGYDKKLKSVWNNDKLTVITCNRLVQTSMNFKKNNVPAAKNTGQPTPSFITGEDRHVCNPFARRV